MNIIDLRSDTVTKPTPGMLQAMMSAEVGDDVFEADPTINQLQNKIADLFGMEAALYCPSGTMTNQIAIRISTQPQEEVICDKYSHIYLYEGAGMMYNSFVSPKLLDGNRGRLTAEQVAEAISPEDIHQPKTSLVSLENTMNKGGGSIYSLSEIKKIREVCDQQGLKLHLDGARLFNALVETRESPKLYGALFNTISICFSKGLGAPVGSVLLGSKESIIKAKRVRKVFGGGMRQAGFLAAACIYALDHQVERLKEDHQRAGEIGAVASQLNWVEEVFSVDTNIVIIRLKSGLSEKDVIAKLKDKNILAVGFGKGLVRFVTHLNFTDDQLSTLSVELKKLNF